MATVYPAQFQAAQVMPYQVAVDMGVLRTPMDSGYARQRRLYRTMPHNFALEFVMPALELGSWQSWVNQFAYDYFEMPLLESMWSGAAGAVASVHSIRFISDLSIENVVYGTVRVKVAAELDPNQAALSGPVVPTFQWIAGGTAADPASPDLVEPGAPPAADSVIAGTPRSPAAIVGV